MMKLALPEGQQGRVMTVRGFYQDWQDALAFFAGLPSVKCPSLYLDCFRSFPPV